MLLIIEGMDRCGKSTLVNQLRKNYFTSPTTIVHHSSSPPKVEDPNEWELDHYRSLFMVFKDLVNKYNFDIILDRFHLGAAVYGEKYRGANSTPVYDLDYRHLSGYKNAALILLTDKPSNIAARDDGDSLESSVEEYRLTARAFEHAFARSSARHKLNIHIEKNGGFENTYPSVVEFLDMVKSEQ